jgi:hypothetical protein
VAEWSKEEIELQDGVNAIEAYDAKRWPLGNDPNVRGRRA